MGYVSEFVGVKLVLWGLCLVLWGLSWFCGVLSVILWGLSWFCGVLSLISWGFVAYSGQGCDVDNLKIIEDIATQSCTPTPLHYREKRFL